MTIESLNTLSIVFFVCAAVFLITGVVLFFVLDIISVYGDLSGRTARKAIERMRKENEESGNKAYKPSPVNEKRGRLTDKMSESGRIISRQVGMNVNVGTQKLATDELAPDNNSSTGSNETTVLVNESVNETTLLVNDAPANETTILVAEPQQSVGETTVLVQQAEVSDNNVENVDFTQEVELAFVGSSELIE